MHIAVRRFNEPVRPVFRYFAVAMVVGLIGFGAICERLDEVENQELVDAGKAQARRQDARMKAKAEAEEEAWSLTSDGVSR